jgi:ubiquitin carboxyl-terminal hydrolase 5/13
MPEVLDLRQYKGTGLQPGEVLIPEEASGSVGEGSSGAGAAPVVDEEVLGQLVSMGFSENGSKRAIIATGCNDPEVRIHIYACICIVYIYIYIYGV